MGRDRTSCRALVAAIVVHLHTTLAQQKCGLVPSKVYLAKGEKRQLVFWTDQDYSQAVTIVAQPSTTAKTTSTTTAPEVDSFLQAVNGQLPGFGNNKEQTSIFHFGNNDTNSLEATVVNAEFPEVEVGIEDDEVKTDEFISTTVEGILNTTEDKDNNDINATEIPSTTLEPIRPVTAANVAEVENDVWINIPEDENKVVVDKWPNPPVQPVLAEETSTILTENIDSTTLVDEMFESNIHNYSEEDDEKDIEPVTDAVVAEVEDDAWLDAPTGEETAIKENWPAPPVASVLAEEETTTSNSKVENEMNDEMDESFELVTDAIVAEIEENAWVDPPSGEKIEIIDKWPSLPVAGVLVEEESSTDDSNFDQVFNPETDAQFADEGSGSGGYDMIIEITTVEPPLTAPNFIEIEENAWVDLPNDEVVDDWPNLAIEADLAEEKHNHIAEDEQTGGNISITEAVFTDKSPGNKLIDSQNEDAYKDETETTTANEIHFSLKTNNESLQENQYAEETSNYSDTGANDLEYTTKAIIMETNTSIIEDELQSEAVLLKEQTTLLNIEKAETTTLLPLTKVNAVEESTTEMKFDVKEENIETSAATMVAYKEEDIPEERIATTLFNNLDTEESTTEVIQKKQNVDITKTTSISQDSTIRYGETGTESNSIFDTKIVEDIDQILEIYQNITENKSDNFEDNKDDMEYTTTAGYEQSSQETKISFTNKELEAVNDETSLGGYNNIEEDIGNNERIVFPDEEQHESTTQKEASNQVYDDALEDDEYLDDENAISTTFAPVVDDKTEVSNNKIDMTKETEIEGSGSDNNLKILEDKVQVVTSMTLQESEEILKSKEVDSDRVTVITSSPFEEPIRSWEDLESFESDTESPLEDTTGFSELEKNFEDMSLESTSTLQPFVEIDEKIADNTNSESFEGSSSLEPTNEPTSDTIIISTQDDNIKNNDDEKKLSDEASILFGLNVPVNNLTEDDSNPSTYFPITENEIQDDDIDYSYYDANFDQSSFQEAENVKVFSFTTTGSPVALKETNKSDDLDIPLIQAVLADTEIEENGQEIFDETTTGSSIPSNGAEKEFFSIEAIESETENVFDETTTLSNKPLLLPNNVNQFEVEAIESETEIIETIVEFDETTTGEPLKQLPSVQAVVAEVGDEDDIKEFEFTTIRQYIQADALSSDDLLQNDVKDTTTVEEADQTIVTMGTTNLDAETPAFTTAASKANATTTSIGTKNVDSAKIIFPNEIEETIAMFATKDELDLSSTMDEAKNMSSEVVSEKAAIIIDDKDDIEYTTIRIVENPAFTSSSNKNAETSDKPGALIDETQQIKVESEIVQVEAGNVNGPLSLDEVIYYDDPDGDEDVAMLETSTSEIPENTDVENKHYDTTEIDEEGQETTTMSEQTTVINGFIINKKQIVKTIDNNDIETVRTSGDNDVVNINIANETSSDITETFTTSPSSQPASIDIIEKQRDPTTVMPKVEDSTGTTSGNTKENDMTNESEDSSTKNPNVVIDLVDNVLKIESLDSFDNNITSSDNATLATTTESQNSTNSDKDKKPATFPVTELLNGIYKLIQGYIPTRAEIDPSVETIEPDSKIDYSKYPGDIEYFDSPNAEPLINVHNAPRDTTPFTTPKPFELEDSVDLANSNTDPFQQLSAPDLTGLIPETEREENVQYIFASQVKKSPPITLSPFNSGALRVEEPPKVLFDGKKENIENIVEEEESGFSTLTKAIQQPFKVFLPSFLKSPKAKPKSDKVQVAGSLPVTVRDPLNGQRLNPGRRPLQKQQESSKSRFPILGSLFSSLSTNSPKKPSLRQRRPLRPDVPAQPSTQTGFVPMPTRQRSSPVSIPLPGSVELDSQNIESKFSPKSGRLAREEPIFNTEDSINKRLRRYIEETPLPIRTALLKPKSLEEELERQRRAAEEPINCTWTIQTERNLYLLVTFHNLSAPFTVDCEGAYIEVERENNGFEARWCGNRVTQGGSRPHVIFARNEVRITVFDDGLEGKTLPTGFNADVEVIDLFDAGEFSSLRKTNGYSSVRKLAGRSLIR